MELLITLIAGLLATALGAGIATTLVRWRLSAISWVLALGMTGLAVVFMVFDDVGTQGWEEARQRFLLGLLVFTPAAIGLTIGTFASLKSRQGPQPEVEGEPKSDAKSDPETDTESDIGPNTGA